MERHNVFKIRTVTAFVTLRPPSQKHHNNNNNDHPDWMLLEMEQTLQRAARGVRKVAEALVEEGYKVQTVRIATNPFPEWLLGDLLVSSSWPSSSDRTGMEEEEKGVTNKQTRNTMKQQLDIIDEESKEIVRQRLCRIDQVLEKENIDFCSLGPANDNDDDYFGSVTITHAVIRTICPLIIQTSGRLACSASLPNNHDPQTAHVIAQCVWNISQLGGTTTTTGSGSFEDQSHIANGLGNFRFCMAAATKPYIPFFPVAKAASWKNVKTTAALTNHHPTTIKFAIGLENGEMAWHRLKQAKTIANIPGLFKSAIQQDILPVQEICQRVVSLSSVSDDDTGPLLEYVGIDTSLNPSLDSQGSVARAIEQLDEVVDHVLGKPGTVAAAAVITEALQSLPNIKLTGYCGLMLPLCEDQRLAELANAGSIGIDTLLSISHVCGVGIDTVPISGKDEDGSERALASLLLDVAGVAHRWKKQLSCRVFPVPGKSHGEMTSFDSPHMVNARILPLSR